MIYTVLDSTKLKLRIGKSVSGGIPYTDHEAQITPHPLILFIFCFYAYFMLGLGLPRRVRKEI